MAEIKIENGLDTICVQMYPPVVMDDPLMYYKGRARPFPPQKWGAGLDFPQCFYIVIVE